MPLWRVTWVETRVGEMVVRGTDETNAHFHWQHTPGRDRFVSDPEVSHVHAARAYPAKETV